MLDLRMIVKAQRRTQIETIMLMILLCGGVEGVLINSCVQNALSILCLMILVIFLTIMKLWCQCWKHLAK